MYRTILLKLNGRKIIKPAYTQNRYTTDLSFVPNLNLSNVLYIDTIILSEERKIHMVLTDYKVYPGFFFFYCNRNYFVLLLKNDLFRR